MTDKVWTADELDQMTPAEQDAVFESSLVNDVAAVPPDFLDRVRKRVQKRIADDELRRR